MDDKKNEREIREAWFLFSRKDEIGFIRLICLAILCLISVFALKKDETIQSYGKLQLIYSLSLAMEFFPHFSKYPQHSTNQNKALMRRKKRWSSVFLFILAALLIFSCVISFGGEIPGKLSTGLAFIIYLVLYGLCFIYLAVNCWKGMMYDPEPPIDTEAQINAMTIAAQTGGLGNVPND